VGIGHDGHHQPVLAQRDRNAQVHRVMDRVTVALQPRVEVGQLAQRLDPANCISHTGRMPTVAAPTAIPMIPASASGVSITRAVPNPSVTLKAPPNPPTSSPITKTRSSARISVRRPSEMACR